MDERVDRSVDRSINQSMRVCCCCPACSVLCGVNSLASASTKASSRTCLPIKTQCIHTYVRFNTHMVLEEEVGSKKESWSKLWTSQAKPSRAEPSRAEPCVPCPFYFVCIFNHAVSIATPKPVASPLLAFHTGPAMSRCSHCTLSVTKSERKRAAVIEPPARVPVETDDGP